MININFYILFLGFLFCCQKSEKSKNDLESAQNEKFEYFLEKFLSNKDFQLQRIKFPLRNKILNTDTNNFEVNEIQRNDWKYFTLNSKKCIKKNLPAKKIFTLNVQILETGISVDYNFEQKAGKWFLIEIIDQST